MNFGTAISREMASDYAPKRRAPQANKALAGFDLRPARPTGRVRKSLYGTGGSKIGLAALPGEIHVRA